MYNITYMAYPKWSSSQMFFCGVFLHIQIVKPSNSNFFSLQNQMLEAAIFLDCGSDLGSAPHVPG